MDLAISSLSLPTMILILGAFLPPSCFDAFLPYLHHAGYTTSVIPPTEPQLVSSRNSHLRGGHLAIRNTFLVPLIPLFPYSPARLLA